VSPVSPPPIAHTSEETLSISCLKDGPHLSYISAHNPDILGLVETQSIKQKIPAIPNYFNFSVKANPTGGRPSGGVIIFVKNSLKKTVSLVKTRRSDSLLWIRISGEVDTFICFCYVRIEKKSANCFYENLSRDVLSFSENGKVIIFGDFNARLGDFVGDTSSCSNKQEFLSFMEFHNFHLLNKVFSFGEPTFHNVRNNSTSIIDFSLTNDLGIIQSFSVNKMVMGSSIHSSHKILQCEINRLSANKCTHPPPHGRSKRPFNHVTEENVESYSEVMCKTMIGLHPYLLDILGGEVPENKKSVVKQVFKRFLHTFDSAKKSSLGQPPAGPQRRAKATPPARHSAELDKVASQITETLQQLGDTGMERSDRSNLFSKLERLENAKSELVAKLVKNDFEKFLSKIETLDFEHRSRQMYLEVKKITHRKLREENPIVLEQWASFFENLYSPKYRPPPAALLSVNELSEVGPPELSADISFEEIENALKNAARHKSPGEDLTKIEELAVLLDDPEALNAVHTLILIFWKYECIPSVLKNSIIVPFLKNAEKNRLDPKNYRPIALLSNFLKLYQCVLDARLIKFLECNGVLADEQYGFRPDRSLLDAHLVLADAILSAKHRRGPRGGSKPQPLYLAFLDIRKTF